MCGKSSAFLAGISLFTVESRKIFLSAAVAHNKGLAGVTGPSRGAYLTYTSAPLHIILPSKAVMSVKKGASETVMRAANT